MKHEPFFSYAQGDAVPAIPFPQSAINRWHVDHEDLEDEIGILSHEEEVHHDLHGVDGPDHETLLQWSVMRVM